MSFADDVRRGLIASPRFLLPQYFYDALGSALFNAICELPEYYVTRTETEILTSFREEIITAFRPPVRLVELGSGSGIKTRILIEALLERQPTLEYAPLDIDPHILEVSARDLRASYPDLRVTPLLGDFRDLGVHLTRSPLRTIVLFLGSTIGNLDPDDAVALMTSIRTGLHPGDAFFLGADLRKPVSVLEPAYDDPLGVTAAFNKNLLVRINRELGGNFELDAFTHRAWFNDEASRVEMHLVSRTRQQVRIAKLDLEIELGEGESIHTENSYKYDEATLDALAARAGFEVAQRWTDSRGWFTDTLLRARA